MGMTITPIHDNVVVKPSSKEEVTAAGIVLPDTVDKEKPEQGEVIAVGPGRLLDNGQRAELSVTVGDTVVFKKYAPDEITVDNQDYLVITERDIIAVLS